MKCNSCGYEMTELENGSHECHVAWCPEHKKAASETLKECVYCGNQFAFEKTDKKSDKMYKDYICPECAVECKFCKLPKGEHYTDEYGVKYCGITISDCECNDFEPVKGEIL